MASERNTLLPTVDSNSSERPDNSSSYQNATDEDGGGETNSPPAPPDAICAGSTSAALIVLALMVVLPLAAFMSGTNVKHGVSPLALESDAPRNPSLRLDDLPLEGKSKKTTSECENDKKYSKHTVKTAYELPFSALFRDTKGQKKFEASSVTIVGNEVYAVCDSSWAISKFDSTLTPFSADNVQIGSPDRDGDYESGYEAIFHHEGSFFVVRESVLHHDHQSDDGAVVADDESSDSDNDHSYHAIIEELKLSEADYTVVSECSSEFEFEGDGKGFEGAIGFADEDGVLYIIGLCEGNYCSESRKDEKGNGRLVIMKKREGDDVPGGCLWETVRMVKLPPSAYFTDYSAMDITDDGRVAITSQEDSAVWLGEVGGIANGIIDPELFAFDRDNKGRILQFPKSSDCHTVYCNIEGIHWMNGEMLMAVSDKMKGRGKQDFRCFDKDQSIHAFVLP